MPASRPKTRRSTCCATHSNEQNAGKSTKSRPPGRTSGALSSKLVSRVCAKATPSSCGVWTGLGRNLADLIGLVSELEQRKINFESITETIETLSPAGRLLFYVFAALAEFERNLIRERTVAGLTARPRCRTGGRPPKLTPKEIKTIRALLNRLKYPSPKSPPASISTVPPSTGPSSSLPTD